MKYCTWSRLSLNDIHGEWLADASMFPATFKFCISSFLLVDHRSLLSIED
jgi:hypothetical protein